MSTPVQAWANDPDYDTVHALRFRRSMEWIQPLLQKGITVLSHGDSGSFERRVYDVIGPSSRLDGYPYDLRYAFDRQLRNVRYDLALCMEVFEHIHDQDCAKPTEWRATGTANLLRETFEHMKPGGHLFLTTPNACSLNAIHKALKMEPPMVYRPHVREYSPGEIVALVEAAGFNIVRFDTLDVWGGNCPTDAVRALAEKYFPSPHRGEDIFVLAQRPSAA